jgi:hypothetical protein
LPDAVLERTHAAFEIALRNSFAPRVVQALRREDSDVFIAGNPSHDVPAQPISQKLGRLGRHGRSFAHQPEVFGVPGEIGTPFAGTFTTSGRATGLQRLRPSHQPRGGRSNLLPKATAQWLIIHGRADGNDLSADDPVSELLLFLAPEQQPQPAPWLLERRGSCDDRSFVSAAMRLSRLMPRSAGAVRIARGASPPHSGQACGSSNSAIARMAENGPQLSQS